MAAPIRFLSGRQQQQKIGIEGSTEDKKVLEVVGRAGIGTTSFEPSKVLDVRGDAIVEGTATLGNLEITGTGGVPASLNVASTLSVTGLSTFSSAVDVNAGLDVDGQADLDEVVVAGVATFSNAVDINSTLDVDGDTQLDDLNVAGVATFSSAINATDIIKGYEYTAAPFGATVTLAVTVASKDSTHRYNGTGSSNAYVIDGIQSPFLTLTPGRTYRFTNDNTGSHPFRFYLEADKTTQYDTNVNFQDTYTEITITDETPIVLHYQCSSHPFMGNAIQTNANVVNTNYPATIRSTLNVTGVSTFPQLDVSTGGLDVDGLTNLDEVVVAGVSTFTGNIVAVSAEFSGNVTIAGTLTAEDKTNIDSLGIVTARTGVRVDAGGLIVTAGVSTFTDSVDIDNGVGVVGGLTADSLTISGVTTGINAAGISSFVRIDVDGQADLDEVVIAGVATFQGAVNFDVNSEINIGTGVTILGNNLHVTGIVSAAQFIGDGSGITNLPGISTLGSSNLTDVNVSGTTTTAQLRISGIGTAEKFFVSTGGFEVDGQSDLDELVVAGVSTFNANTNVVGDLSVTGDIGASGIITATGINLVAGSGLDVGAIGVLTALSVDVSTGGIDVDGQATLDEVVVAGVATFSALADVNNRLDVAGGANIDQLNVAGIASFTQLDVSTGGIDVDGQATLDEVVVSGASTFTGAVKIDGALDIGTAGVDIDGQTDLDELQVAGVSTFSAKAVFNTAYPSIDADNEIQVGTAIQLGKAGVVTATTFVGNLTGDVTGTASNASGATGDFSIADKIVHTGDTNTALRFPAADTFTIETAGSERVRVSSAGTVSIGSAGRTDWDNSTNVGCQFQIEGTTLPSSRMSITRNSNNAFDGGILLGKSRGTSDGSATIVQDGDGLGFISFQGADGTTMLEGAKIDAIVQSSVASDDMPTDLVFYTNNDTTTTEERLRITSTGNVNFLGSLVNVNATGVSSFVQLDVSTGGLDVDGQTDLDEVVVSGVSTFSAKAVFNTAYPSIDADNEIQVGTAIQLGKAGVITATSFSGDGSALTGIAATDHVSTFDLVVAGISTFNDDVRILAGGLNVTGVSTFQSHVHLGNDDELRFGAAAAGDMVISHTGDHGTIDNNDGNLNIKSEGNIELNPNNTNDGLKVINQGAVEAYHNNVKKLETSISGITVTGGVNATGVITATSFSGSGANLTGIGTQGPDGSFRGLTVAGISTFNGNVSIGSSVLFGDNNKAMFGAGDDLQIYHDGTDSYVDNSTGDLILRSTGDDVIIRATDDVIIQNGGSDNAIICNNDGNVELYFNTAKRFETTTDGADFSGTGGIKLPVGSTAQRPGSPTAGDLRYNSDDGAFEGYTDSWGAIGGGTPEVDTNVSSTSAVGVGSFATASFRSAEVIAQIVQIDEYQVGKYLMIHDGTTVTVIEQAAVSTGDAMIGSFDGAINGSNAELRVTMVSSGIATVTTKISTVTV